MLNNPDLLIIKPGSPKKMYGDLSATLSAIEPLATKYLSNNQVLRFRDKAFEEYCSNSGYLRMIKKKFGPEIVNHIKEILGHKIKRKFA